MRSRGGSLRAGARCERVSEGTPPNMRLKLAGADRSKGSGVFVPWRARTFVYYSCTGGHVARS